MDSTSKMALKPENEFSSKSELRYKIVIFLLHVIFLVIIVSFSMFLYMMWTPNEFYPASNDVNVIPESTINRAVAYSKHPIDLEELKLIRNPNLNETKSYKLVCYYSFPNDNWRALQPENIDASLCTHIIVSFAHIQNNTIQLSAGELKILAGVINLKKTNKKLKVLLSVGGAGSSEYEFPKMVSTHDNRKIFIRSVLNYVKIYNIDGVDLDWEFPIEGEKDRMHFTQLLGEFRKVISKQEKHKFLLTVAVAAPIFLIDVAYDVSYINQYVDFVNLMSYDYHFYTKWTPFTGFNSPLYSSVNENGYLATLNINASSNHWIAKGMERNKLIVGLPTYGHTFTLINTFNNELYAPAGGYGHLGSNGFADFGQICDYLMYAHAQCTFDAFSKSPYAVKNNEWISYDDVQSLSYKAKYVREQNFGGAMVYSLNADDYAGKCRLNKINKKKFETFPLIRAIKNVLNSNNCEISC